MGTTDEPLVAQAHPSKGFFIDMLTRDVTLPVCVLDLIDNSIHSLIAKNQIDVSGDLFKGKQTKRIDRLVTLTIERDRFVLTDNCGGIPIAEARDRVFLLGNPVKEKTRTGLGVYGIGLKRAMFKIGRKISISSHTTEEQFRIDIDVDEWEKSQEWILPFTSAGQKKSPSGGTTIEIARLHNFVSEQFASKSFSKTLLDRIGTAYALFLNAGLTIKVNDVDAVGNVPVLAESRDLKSHRHMVKEDDVDILFMVGVSPRSDSKPRGWYVFCNGRLVLDGDQTWQTGWGVDLQPGFHVKYNHFLGFVFFKSKDMQKLPWNTTKDGVVWESPIYQRAVAEMRLLSRPVLDFLNNLYSDVAEQSEPEHNLLKQAKAVNPTEIARRKETTFQARPARETGDTEVNIQYKRPKKMLDAIKAKLGRKMAAYQIGEYTFDWFFDRNCK